MRRRPPAEEYLEKLMPLGASAQELTLAVRDMVLAYAPEANEVPYDILNAVATCYTFTEGETEAFIFIAAYPTFVNLGFNSGSELTDPGCILRGEGLWIRYVRLASFADAERMFVDRFIKEAVVLARSARVIDHKAEPEARILTERIRKPKSRQR